MSAGWYKSGWTDERKALQREAIQRWKPWEKSTGPKTEGGKAQAAMNGREAYLMQMPVRDFLKAFARM